MLAGDAWVEEVIKVFVAVFVVDLRSDVVICTLSSVKVGVIIDSVCDFGMRLLIVNVLVAAVAALEFAMALGEESLRFC